MVYQNAGEGASFLVGELDLGAEDDRVPLHEAEGLDLRDDDVREGGRARRRGDALRRVRLARGRRRCRVPPARDVLYVSTPIEAAKEMSAVCDGETNVPPTSTTPSAATSKAPSEGR